MNNNIRMQFGFDSSMEAMRNAEAIAEIKSSQEYARNWFYRLYTKYDTVSAKRLASCNARIIRKAITNSETGEIEFEVEFLQSYSTIVAARVLPNDCGIDTDLLLFGTYSATTWQHVNRFSRSYNRMDYVTGWAA